MSTYHILRKPVSRLPDGNVQWEAHCGLRLSLRPGPEVKPGGTVQTRDKQGNEVIECAGCYASVEDQPKAPATDPDAERPLAPGAEVDDPNFGMLGEENEEFPEK